MSDPLEQSLSRSRSHPRGSCRSWRSRRGVQSRFRCVQLQRVVIVGCGHLGMNWAIGWCAALPDWTSLRLRTTTGVRWDATQMEGLSRWSSLSEAVARHNEHAFFVVAIYNGTPVRQQISDFLAGARVVPYPLFFWHVCETTC